MLQGPNMNRLGKRDPSHYGTQTLVEAQQAANQRAAELDAQIEHFQSNSEGTLLDWLHERQEAAAGIICNPGGLSNYGVSLRDAFAEAKRPIAIVNLSNIYKREAWRRLDIFAEIADVYIMGAGPRGYVAAVELLVKHIREIG